MDLEKKFERRRKKRERGTVRKGSKERKVVGKVRRGRKKLKEGLALKEREEKGDWEEASVKEKTEKMK